MNQLFTWVRIIVLSALLLLYLAGANNPDFPTAMGLVLIPILLFFLAFIAFGVRYLALKDPRTLVLGVSFMVFFIFQGISILKFFALPIGGTFSQVSLAAATGSALGALGLLGANEKSFIQWVAERRAVSNLQHLAFFFSFLVLLAFFLPFPGKGPLLLSLHLFAMTMLLLAFTRNLDRQWRISLLLLTTAQAAFSVDAFLAAVFLEIGGLVIILISLHENQFSLYQAAFYRRREADLSRFVLDAMECEVVVIDSDGRVVSLNPAAEIFFQCHKHDVLGQEYRKVFRDQITWAWHILNTLETGYEYCNQEVVAQNCGERKLVVNTHQLRDWQGRVIGAVATFRDITHQEKLEALHRSQERLVMAGQTAAAAAHEIRNPLAGIKGFLQLAQKRGSEGMHYLKMAEVEVGRVEELVREFLFLAKPPHLKMDKVNLKEVLDSVSRPPRVAEGLASKMERCYSDLEVYGDREKLMRIMQNLVSNALEATPPESKVVIRARRVQDRAVIEVENGGKNLSGDVLEKVFEPFYSTKERGTGLGLAISKRIVEDHGGTISCHNLEPEGVRVIVSLPIGGAERPVQPR